MHLRALPSSRNRGEDQADHLLNPQVGIEAEADLAMPEVADRHADAQFAPPRLGASGVEHAGTQDAKLELADAALHAQQEPIVRAAGIVDPIQSITRASTRPHSSSR